MKWTPGRVVSKMKERGTYRATVAELAARSPHDRKVVGSNPRWVQY